MKSIFLIPSILYGFGVAVWNKLYDLSVFRSKKGVIPTISIGNLTVGGTGKTPHTEYLLSLLSRRVNTAYISRGYKRQTKGFYLAKSNSNSDEIGDEAFQVKEKYKDVVVAVDADRHHALRKLKDSDKNIQIAILDDAYQHRQLIPDLNILLIDYNRPTYSDHMLPYGELRESGKNTDRADIIIITKCPEYIKPVNCRMLKNRLDPYPYQSLYFTKLIYKEAKFLYKSGKPDLNGKEILVITGIAQPKHLHRYLKKEFNANITIKEYPDHYNFTMDDINSIKNDFETLNEDNKIIVTTEKDAARLLNMNLPKIIKNNICSIGIGIEFLYDSKDKFDKQIDKFLKKQKIQMSN